jgi:ribonuclease P protein subunit RPR2
MIRAAQERITALFGLAESEARRGSLRLADRYVGLARRVGMRYNVRLLPEYRELYCRRCSVFWVPGRTVRLRLRRGRRVATCLACGHTRRVPLAGPRIRAVATEFESPSGSIGEPILADEPGLDSETFEESGEEE